MDMNILKSIPKIDELLKSPQMTRAITNYGKTVVVNCARMITEEKRNAMVTGDRTELIDPEKLVDQIEERIYRESRMSLRPVINATGIILHTNLGRAILSETAAQAVYDIARNYSTLEYNCATGERGSRYSHIDDLLGKLCSCESALVVNNNAAAVLLILNTLAKDQEVIVSRGELVEIGGAFRVPEVMEQSNSILVEVGTTNKTRIRDYEAAIHFEKTAVLLKVHTSNYKIMGFTEDVSLHELAELGRKNDIPVVYDLGSGAFFKAGEYHLSDEPNITDSLNSGIDVISFSGDKLLGGPQAGIIVGKKKYIDMMKKNPLTRAIRVDKMTLAALEATLRLYFDMNLAEKEIPILSKLLISQDELLKKAEQLLALLENIPTLTATIIEDFGQVGGGSMPNQMIPSVCVAVETTLFSVNAIDKQLHQSEIPIIGRINKNRYLLDLRTIESKDLGYIAKELKKIVE
ncbi:selenocysteine synthase [Acetobacterium bakii]|uniref:L-seryl-tRNA(Sec) selenium transferase n=1 Tax=Acetobacterium bakii TaxID=52689 RepID=A0A0L6U4L2_9FIRM|nr:selenocysteine synthase [Acetobacterium bakii]